MVGYPHDGHLLDPGIPDEIFLQLPRVHIESTHDHHVLLSPDDAAVPLIVHHCEVTGVQPSFLVDGIRGLFRHVIVSFHDIISTTCQLSCLADRHFDPFIIDDLHLNIRKGSAHRFHPLRQGILEPSQCDQTAFGQSVGYADVALHDAHDPLHGVNRTGSPGHDPGPQGGRIVLLHLQDLQFTDEHGGNAVTHRDLFLLNALQDVLGCKSLHDHHGGTVDHAQSDTEDTSEDMGERHREQDAVIVNDLHDGGGILDVGHHIPVAEHCSLGFPGGAARVDDENNVLQLVLEDTVPVVLVEPPVLPQFEDRPIGTGTVKPEVLCVPGAPLHLSTTSALLHLSTHRGLRILVPAVLNDNDGAQHREGRSDLLQHFQELDIPEPLGGDHSH